MKRLFVCFFIMASVVAVSLWGIGQIQTLKNQFNQLVLKSESLVLQRDFSKADKYLRDFKNSWNELDKKMSYVCNNNDLKEISVLISQLEFYLYDSPKRYFEGCAVLRERILCLLDTEMPDFDGIF